MRKANKQITLDMELILELSKVGLNVSEYCNEKLWDHVTKLRGVKETNKDPKEIDAKMRELNKEKEAIANKEQIAKDMKKEGITPDHIKFLKSMSTNISSAKDMKMAYKKKFGVPMDWSSLLALKRRWT